MENVLVPNLAVKFELLWEVVERLSALQQIRGPIRRIKGVTNFVTT